MHGFYLDAAAKTMRFDVVLSFDIRPKEALSILNEELRKAYPDYRLQIIADVDLAD